MSYPIKPNSFAEIFAKPDSTIDQNIAKGYLLRREVTEILDHVKKNNTIICDSDGNGGLVWNIGSIQIDPNHKTNTTPFWMRRISHWFKLTFSEKYRDKFSDKISKVHEAYGEFLQKTATAQAKNTAKTTADAKALTDSQALQQLQDDILSKESEISPVQAELDQLNQELVALESTREQLNTKMTAASQEIQNLTDHHTNLTNLNLKLNTYLLKGQWLEDEDEPVVQTLEEFIYQGNSSGQLRSPQTRTAQLVVLTDRIAAQKTKKTNLETALATDNASIENKTDSRDLKQAELVSLKTELQALKDRLPSVTNDNVTVNTDQDSVLDQVIEPKQDGIKALLAGKINIDIDAINTTQNIKNNPLISKKALFEKIANRSEDDFYEKTVEPGLKFVTASLAASPKDATQMYNRWKTGLENCADKWKLAGSNEEDIDSLTTFDTLFENIMQANDALDFLAKSNLNVTEFFQNLSSLKIPKDMKFAFAINDNEAEEVLDTYLKDPAGTDLSPLFAPNSNFHTWPRDCQFFLAVSILTVRLDNANLTVDAEARKVRLEAIAEAEKIQEPAWIGIVTVLLKSKFIFNLGLGSIVGKLPAIGPEAVRLAESKQELIDIDPNKKLPDELEEKFKEAFAFAKKPERQVFDKAYIKFGTELRADVINALIAKHKTSKELDLYKIANGAFGLRGPGNAVFDAQKDYLKTLNTGSSQATKHKKLATLEKNQADLLIGTLDFIQSLGAFAINNPTLVKVTKELDDSVMAAMREQGPLNLETTPFIPWFQDTVIKPLVAVV